MKKCIYCNSTENLTKDHIPPKCFFPDPKPSNLISVVCCKKCNNDFGRDDEYVFAVLTMRHDVGEHRVGKKHLEKLKRMFCNPKKLLFLKSIVNSTNVIDVSTPSGIYIGKTLTYQPKGDRILNFMKRLTAGIYFHETKRPLPLNNKFRLLDPSNFERQSELFKKTMSPVLYELINKNKTIIGDNVFSYSYEIHKDNKYIFFSLFSFFEYVQYFCLSIPSLPEPPK